MKYKTGFGHAYERKYAQEIQQRVAARERAKMQRKYSTVDELKAARKIQNHASHLRSEQNRKERVELERGLDRQIRAKRNQPLRLPFYPPVKQLIPTFPPIVPGVWALSFPISTRPVVVQA